jgi:hypothetical protein
MLGQITMGFQVDDWLFLGELKVDDEERFTPGPPSRFGLWLRDVEHHESTWVGYIIRPPSEPIDGWMAKVRLRMADRMRREWPDGWPEHVARLALNLWVCSGCGDLLKPTDGFDPAWRLVDGSWEHKCAGQHPQVGYCPAVRPGR